MGKIHLKWVYHIGIPVNDLESAERFCVDVLGMRVHGPQLKSVLRRWFVS